MTTLAPCPLCRREVRISRGSLVAHDSDSGWVCSGSGRPPAQARSKPTEPEWYTAIEIATKLRVSKMTVYRLIQQDYLRASKFRQQFRIHRDDLARYMQDSAAWK